MYYLGLDNLLVKELPDEYKHCKKRELDEKQVFEFHDNGGNEEFSVKGKVQVSNGIASRVYITKDEFESTKNLKKALVTSVFEVKIDKAVRKSTQDLTFGDIVKIPKDIIVKRDHLKKQYHSIVKAIKAANDLSELNAIAV